MKEHLRKTVSLVLALAMALAISVPGFAADKNLFLSSSNDTKMIEPSGDAMTDKPITIEEQEQALINNNSISNEKKINFLKKFEMHKELIRKSKLHNTLLMDNPSGYINVPYFKQEKNYWCGPATTKQTIHFINGSSSSQSSIASAIGTTTNGSNLSDMVTYLNNNQSRSNYIIITDPDETLIQGISKVIVDSKTPAIGRLKIKKGGNWRYSSNGHFLNISGYKNSGSSIRVTDPYIGWIDTSSSGSYYVTSNEFYTATNNHFARQISFLFYQHQKIFPTKRGFSFFQLINAATQ